MRLRIWLGRTGAAAVRELLVQLRGLGVFFTGPLPGVHYDDLGGDVGPARREAVPGPPPGHPERYCATPPSRQERELWASLGIDTERTGG
ncbi:hypothetical protein Shyhy01_71230 [Streptomyces hygroscopicus subsp. hygroscopicus]|uniref:DUF6059 family protein n=1 Tax=Streptomyces sp. KHY 26 TaxID=3097359 RepID=UPI0024A25616|nr:DUF6059 family protein [Streptomyces hygroscopicus]GLX54174.1 hypothetical protein Shyhy01_71230 [Streptomyces hygroscopicus subsp. hygroscopicus]